MGLEQDGSFGPATRSAMVNWLNQRSASQNSTTTPQTNNGIADNPYNYSSQPTRAIYYVLPTMKGNDVKWVQCALNAYGGYNLAIDGSFGPACRTATKQFQASIGLEQDGSFGPATRSRMVSWLSEHGCSPSDNPPQNNQGDIDGKYNLCWPLPVSASGAKNITSSLGHRNAPVAGASVSHKGIDIGVPAGTNVLATYSGVVMDTGWTNARGNYIVIYHDEIGLTSIYQHLKEQYVAAGQTVDKGSVIGLSGKTGNVSGEHLHFELVKTSSESQSKVDCAWASGAELIDGHYDNNLINYTYQN